MASLTKNVADDRIYTFDFAALEELVAGQTISSATVTAAPSGLTIGSPSVVGATVRADISGGTAGVGYILTVTITTNASAVYAEYVPMTVS